MCITDLLIGLNNAVVMPNQSKETGLTETEVVWKVKSSQNDLFKFAEAWHLEVFFYILYILTFKYSVII